MRELTSHKVNGLNEALKIKVLDDPGAGGACHHYVIHADESVVTLGDGVTVSSDIRFQKGPIAESGVNGISNEALLAIVEDRLWCFQNGPYACTANHVALERVRDAIDALKGRTLERVARGVEGTSTI